LRPMRYSNSRRGCYPINPLEGLAWCGLARPLAALPIPSRSTPLKKIPQVPRIEDSSDNEDPRLVREIVALLEVGGFHLRQ
jgi:hypothetical protein